MLKTRMIFATILIFIVGFGLTVTAAPGDPPLEIEIDVGTQIADVPNALFGSNTAYWFGDTITQPGGEMVQLLQDTGIKLLRYPGGNSTNVFHWADAEESTCAEHGLCWAMNTTEFVAFAQELGAEMMISANFGTGTAQEAADWVAFTNITHDWNVHYWEIGNENYGEWSASWTTDPVTGDNDLTAYEYMHGGIGDDGEFHDGANAYCVAMKAVDPTIEVGLVALNNYGPSWTRIVLEEANDCFDFLIIHVYPFGNTTDYAAVLAAPLVRWPLNKANHDAGIATYYQHQPPLKIAATEYNVSWSGISEPLNKVGGMMFIADSLGQLIVNDYDIANHWDVFNGGKALGLFTCHPDLPTELCCDPHADPTCVVENRLWRQPVYYAFAQWRSAGDRAVSATVNRDGASEMTVYATAHSSDGRVHALVINKQPTSESGLLTFNNIAIPGLLRAEIDVVQGASLDADRVTFNGLSDPPIDLDTVSSQLIPLQGNQLSYTFPPYSMVSIVIEVDPTPTPTPGLPTPTMSPTPTLTPQPLGLRRLYVSSSTNGSVGDLPFRDEDILQFDIETESWALLFDGSDVGISQDVIGFYIASDNTILLAVDAVVTVGEITADYGDILRFVPTSVGDTTAGSFELYFDGSDVGISGRNERIDAIGITPNGDLLVSFKADPTIPGLVGAPFKDEDLFLFTADTLGEVTSGDVGILP